jgi:nitrogen PTS system EIIA component
MNLLSALLPLSNVELDVPAADKRAALHCAADHLAQSRGIDPGRVFQSLVERESLGSTGLGKGVAIPHGRCQGLRESAAAIVRLERPVAFDAPDGGPVQLMVALLVPEQASPQQHLQILSELAQMLSDADFRQQLMSATQPQAVLAALAAWEPMRPAA